MADGDITKINDWTGAGLSTDEQPQSLAKLTSKLFVVANKDYVLTFSVDDNFDNITLVDSLDHDASTSNYATVDAIDETHFIIAYRQSTGTASGYTKTFSCDADGDNIAEIASLKFADGESPEFCATAVIDSTHHAIAYKDSSNNYQLKTFSFDGSYENIALEDTHQFSTTNGFPPNLIKIDATHLATLHYDGSNNTLTTYTLDGNYDITAADTTTIAAVMPSTGYFSYTTMKLVNDSTIIIGGGYNSKAYITTVSFNGSYETTQIESHEIVSATTTTVGVSAIDETHYFVTMELGNSDTRAYSVSADSSYENMANMALLAINTSNSSYARNIELDVGRFVCQYQLDGNKDQLATFSVEGWDPESGTNFKLNISDTFKEVPNMKINIGDSWKEVTAGKVNIGDTWKDIF